MIIRYTLTPTLRFCPCASRGFSVVFPSIRALLPWVKGKAVVMRVYVAKTNEGVQRTSECCVAAVTKSFGIVIPLPRAQQAEAPGAEPRGR